MKKILLFSVFIFAFSSISISLAKDQDLVMAKKISYFEISNTPLSFVIQSLSEKCKFQGVLINFEEAVDPNKDRLYSFKFKDLSINEIVNEILKNDKSYTWTKKGNIINIIPSNINNNEYLLNQTVGKIDIKSKTRDEIVQLVLKELDKKNPGKYRIETDKNEIIYQLVIFNLPYKELGILPPILARHSFEFKDETFRGVLNAISKSENICWQVLLSDENEGMRILVFMDPSAGAGLQTIK